MNIPENKYANSKIYSIRSPNTDKYYIGSTCTSLPKRLYQHKDDYKRFNNGTKNYISSFEIVKYDDCYIELVEKFPCNSKDELNKREGEMIREHKNDCVNRRIEGRTGKEYHIDNIEKIHAQKNVQYDCVCGVKYTHTHRARHFKTNKHQQYILNQQQNDIVDNPA